MCVWKKSKNFHINSLGPKLNTFIPVSHRWTVCWRNCTLKRQYPHSFGLLETIFKPPSHSPLTYPAPNNFLYHHITRIKSFSQYSSMATNRHTNLNKSREEEKENIFFSFHSSLLTLQKSNSWIIGCIAYYKKFTFCKEIQIRFAL